MSANIEVLRAKAAALGLVIEEHYKLLYLVHLKRGWKRSIGTLAGLEQYLREQQNQRNAGRPCDWERPPSWEISL